MQSRITQSTLFVLLAVSAAFAQEDLSSETIEEVIVTGTKQYRSLQDTQTSVTVVTAQDMADQAILNVEDILLRTANVASGGPNSLNNLSIRGTTLTGVGFSGAGTTANVYVDGSPNSFNANQGANNLWDVAQVEVLRGPQSTTQGRNALAGAIIINTADPTHEWEFKGRAMGGNEGQRQYSAVVNAPIITDQVALRFAADYRELDFDVTNVETGNNTRFEEATNLRAKVLIEPNALPDLRLELIASVADTQFGEFGAMNSSVPADDPNFAAYDPYGRITHGIRTRFEDNVVTRYTADLQYSFNGNWDLFGIATYEETERNIDFGPGSRNEALHETQTAELRAAFEYGRLSGWLGAYYFFTEGGDDITFISPLSILGIPVVPAESVLTLDSNTFIETENNAVFVDLSYDFNERWSLNLGARYDEERFDNRGRGGAVSVDPPDCAVPAFIPNIGGIPCAALIPIGEEPPSGAKYSAFLPRASLVHHLDEYRSVSLNIARGYRAGGSYLFALPLQAPESRSYDPEYVINYEIAFRTEWPAQSLIVNANLFYTDWEEQQVSIPDPSGALFGTEILNSGTSRLYGLEVEANKNLTSSLYVFSSLGLLRTEFTRFPFAPGTGTEYEDLEGNEFNNAPNFNVSAGFTYDGGYGPFASGTVSYSSRQFSDVTNLAQNENEDYVLINLRGGWRWEKIEAAVFVDNLFDERFSTRRGLFTVNTATGIAEVNNPSAFFTVNDFRLVGIEMRYTL